jgi:hypothetical protein
MASTIVYQSAVEMPLSGTQVILLPYDEQAMQKMADVIASSVAQSVASDSAMMVSVLEGHLKKDLAQALLVELGNVGKIHDFTPNNRVSINELSIPYDNAPLTGFMVTPSIIPINAVVPVMP